MADDAGVYLIAEGTALVQTLDFFPPVVDDPFDFGRVAAANSLSDVYAMGAKPLTAMNIVGFPEGVLDNEVLMSILMGGVHVASEAGIAVIGGHTIQDKEIKYGLAVTGIVDPKRIITNAKAEAGDVLILTKPIGSGVLTTALRADELSDEKVEKLVAIMVQLNRFASEAMVEFDAHACTDITGYGLLGHCLELAEASGVTLEIESPLVPMMDDALDYAGRGFLTGGGGTNKHLLVSKMEMKHGLDENIESLLFDPQTSGGLLIAVGKDREESLLRVLKQEYPHAARVGRVVPRQSTTIVVI